MATPQYPFPEYLPDTPLVRSAFTDPPPWSGQRIHAWDEDAFREKEPFIVEKTWSAQYAMDVFEVIGTQHPDYQGFTWLEFLRQGKRMVENLTLQQRNPGYYLDDAVKIPTMYYLSLDDSGIHIGGDGNHRTGIARFLFRDLGRTRLEGCNYTSYRTDHHAWEIFTALRAEIARKRLAYLVEPQRKTLAREDGSGWMTETYQLGIRIQDLSKGSCEVLSVEEAEAKLSQIQKTGFSSWLGKIFRLS